MLFVYFLLLQAFRKGWSTSPSFLLRSHCSSHDPNGKDLRWFSYWLSSSPIQPTPWPQETFIVLQTLWMQIHHSVAATPFTLPPKQPASPSPDSRFPGQESRHIHVDSLAVGATAGSPGDSFAAPLTQHILRVDTLALRMWAQDSQNTSVLLNLSHEILSPLLPSSIFSP